jgi:hypothetical protein
MSHSERLMKRAVPDLRMIAPLEAVFNSIATRKKINQAA